MTEQQSFARIPEPPETFLLGHLLTLSAETPVQDMWRLARELGPIFRLELRGRVLVIVSGYELVNEISDEKRFDKSIRGGLRLVRRFGGDGLFTSKTEEPNWAKAHNIMLPNFNQKAMESYHAAMLDIAEQLALKWERLNPDEEIDVARDMTSLTVDTIGLSGFDYRFNSFYHDKEHPFVGAMADALSISMDELRDVPMENLIRQSRERQLQEDIRTMNETVDRMIRERRASGEDSAAKTDMLGYLLSGVDKKTGERLDDINIRYQVITFLIAGHETTSGLLSFALYELLQNPAVLAKAYEEVDRVLGPEPTLRPTYKQVNELKYITQLLKETLRLWPTAPVFGLYPYEDTVIGGKYKIKRQHTLTVFLPMLHRDPTVWGPDAERFNPDNFSPAAEAQRPPNAWKPFGNGKRACIGRQFALQEATLVLGMLLHRFKLIDHTRYQLKIKETLTIKPEGFKLKVQRRTARDRHLFAPSAPATVTATTTTAITATTTTATTTTALASAAATTPQHGTPLLVLYGSNLGTAEELARRIAGDGEASGFSVKIAPLDDYVGRLPKEGLLAIVTSSYNGLPPDNAVKFCDWLCSAALPNDALTGVTYAVFGCGNRDWAATFQAVPRLLDHELAAHGALRLFHLGEGDARDDFAGQFLKWYEPLRVTVAETLGLRAPSAATETQPLYRLEIVPRQSLSPFVDSFNAVPLTVRVNRELQRQDGPHAAPRSTRHLELALPPGVTYKAGDHLGVIPQNSDTLVQRVVARFGFDREVFLRLRPTTNRKTFLPTEQPISLFQLLRHYVELQDVATRAQLQTLATFTECPPERAQLAALAADETRYKEEVLAKRKSLLDLLEEFPACALPFEVYLEQLGPLRPRYYSISSSPLLTPDVCSLTVAVLEGPARSGRGNFAGVCTNYLREQAAGSVLYGFVKDTKSAFRLPENPATPLILLGPGTGLAPFRGFLQERAALQQAGQTLGPAWLFFGCRHPQQDFLYEDELRAFESQGVVKLVTAFSRLTEQKRYVQDELYVRRDAVWALLEAGAQIYVCGDASRMAADVRRTFARIYAEKLGLSEAAAEQQLDQMIAQQRYLVDVWAAN